MPAPKHANTAAATTAAADARNRIRDARDAQRLRDRGYTVTPGPDADTGDDVAVTFSVAELQALAAAVRRGWPTEPPGTDSGELQALIALHTGQGKITAAMQRRTT